MMVEERISWYYGIVFVLSIITYLNAIPADFVFDDTAAIQGNPDIVAGTSITSLIKNDFWGTPIGSRFSHQSYRPVTVLSFRMDYEIWNDLVRQQFHFTNVALHAVASCAFLRLCCNFIFTTSPHLSIMSAILFATHPVHVEAVTGLVGRAEILCAVFFMISIECHARACRASVRSSRPWTRNIMFMILCVFSSCLALLSKEIGVTSLGVCFAYDLLAHLEIRANGVSLQIFRQDDVKRTIFRLLTLCIAAACIIFTRLQFLGGFVPHFSEPDNPGAYNPSSLTRVLTLNYYNFRNLWVMIYPKVLCCDWAMGSIPVVESWSDSRNIGTLLMYLVLMFSVIHSAFSRSQTSRSILIGLVMLIVPYIPSTNLFVVVGFVTAERTLYIPSLGFCVLLVITLDKIISFCCYLVSYLQQQQQQQQRKRIFTYITTCIVCAYVTRTTIRNGDWNHEEMLWRSGIEVNPLNSKLHGNLGSVLMRTNRFDEARYHLNQSVHLKWGERNPDALSNFGHILMFRDNKTHEARKYFEIAVRNEPLHASAHINLGISHMIDKDGDIRIADEHFRTVLSFSPLSTGTSSQLTITAARLRAFLHDGYGMKPEQFPERRDPVKAIEAYRYHLKLESNNANARHRLYVLLRSEGRLEEAREIFPNDHDDALIRAEMALAYKLLKEEKQFQEAETLIWNLIKRIKDKIQIVNLADTIGTVYVSKKLYAEAARAYDVAVKADPTRARLWNNLGHVQLHLKLVDEAEMNVLKALELDPSLKSAKVNMEVIETFRSSL